ncbi:MAG TPA: SpoIIE family protein phosphatase, partial [bacterium]|nr:SpoIIE family protein phosphatase [bacterium]
TLLRDVILYAVLVAIFIAIFLIGEYISDSYFPRTSDYVIFFFKALVFILIYEPIRKLTELYIRKIVFSYYYRRQEDLRDLDARLVSTMGYHEMADIITERISGLLNVKYAAIYLRIPEFFSLVSSYGRSDLITKRIKADMAVYDALLSGKRVFTINELFVMHQTVLTDDALKVFQHEGCKYIIPMLKKDGISALLVLGEETQIRYDLSDEDKKILWQSMQRVGNTLESTRLYSQLQKSLVEKEIVLEIAKKFNGEIHTEKLLDNILDAVKSIVPYDAAGIFLVNEVTQEIESAVMRGYDPEVMEQIRMKVGTGLIGHVAIIGKPVIVKDVNFDEHYVSVRDNTRSEITIPIKDSDRTIGVLNLESDMLGAYHEGFLDILNAIAGEAGIAIQNAQLNEQAIRNEELQKELKIAGKIQQAILPQQLPRIPNLQITAKSLPCYAVGGDFYDVLKLNDHQVTVSIGDVSGKGVPGAIMMSVLYTSYRGMVHEYKTSWEVVNSLNNLLCTHTAEGRYATFFHCIIDFERLIMYYTNAGHNPPMIRKESGEWIKLREGGIVLGFIPDQDYRQMTQPLDPGDIIVLYTDGITEVFNEAEELFGEERLKEVIENNRETSAKNIQDEIIAAVSTFAPDQEMQQDDITLVIIKIEKSTLV